MKIALISYHQYISVYLPLHPLQPEGWRFLLSYEQLRIFAIELIIYLAYIADAVF